ncbi:MAG TPA: endolytic transglycosylase MltG [Methyloceanibacter sp.]|nr:endolytic transglycosylase MltG [Methyloceanibacter sp.]
MLPRSPSEALVPQRPPEPPEREEVDPDPHPFLRMFDGLVTFIFLMACLVVGAYYWAKVKFDQPGPAATSTVVVIPRGEGVSAIAERLQRDGVIADRRIFMTSILYFMYLKGQRTLKAGEYEFPKHASVRQVLDTLVEGKSIEHKVTLAEGLTSYQIVQKLLAHPELKGEIAEVPPEGTLLPDTYKFGRSDTRQDIVERMQAAQKKFLAKVWETRAEDIVVRTPEEALILASIVEKETGRADERTLVAAVFRNRLKKNMRLQSDSTIIYGLVGGKGALDGPILREDLDRETAYNTYKINGLPPTPIANPGRASIEAVLRPANSKDLYFVADGTGGHVFAATLDEHNKNVFKWRKIERELRAQEAAAKAEQEAAAPAAGQGTAEAAAEPGAAPPLTAGAPVPKTVPGTMAADPMSGTLADPAILMAPSQPLEAPAGAAAGEAVPAPPRNPKR